MTGFEQSQGRFTRLLPDFRNLGVAIRIFILVLVITLFSAVLESQDISGTLSKFLELCSFVQPTLLCSFLIFYLITPKLRSVPYQFGILLSLFLLLSLVSILHSFACSIFDSFLIPNLSRCYLLSSVSFLIILFYFDLRQRALTPAIAEARIQALQARIRPHFLFNSINAVLSLIRSNPNLAETALEDMADLFRVLMSENRDLVPMAKEIALSRQYLALEKLRLVDRLIITWEIDSMPPDVLIPPLILQPLLENAVYHGIEPLEDGGEISIKIFKTNKQVHIILTNPYPSNGNHHSGNKIALSNIRERLSLHFDAEASLNHKILDNKYQVHILLPYHL